MTIYSFVHKKKYVSLTRESTEFNVNITMFCFSFNKTKIKILNSRFMCLTIINIKLLLYYTHKIYLFLRQTVLLFSIFTLSLSSETRLPN